MKTNQSAAPYEALTQDRLIHWLETIGLETDYRIYPLNSYENRVYRVGIENAPPIIVKIYRPGRWSGEQIQEELSLIDRLNVEEVSVVPALEINQQILHQADGFYFVCFPMRAGHAFELDNADKLYRIGQLLGRMHGFCKAHRYRFRDQLSITQPVLEASHFFAHSNLIPSNIQQNYLDTLKHILKLLLPFEEFLTSCSQFPIHGDFHAGNILDRNGNILLVDFDDTKTGPAMQDIWKLLSGNEQQQKIQLNEISEGYEQFSEFPLKETHLIEALRTSHMVKHALWIARRWHDPAFPQAFPWFNNERYWGEHLLNLREQWANLQG